MDGLTLKIINGNKKALALARTCVTTPTLINIYSEQGAIGAIPLDSETIQKSANAEVSENLVIASSDQKKNITDNVAPGSKSWTISGYIKGIKQLEPSNYFQPFVQTFTDILWSWFDHGAVLIFKDGNAHVHERVVIKDLKTSQQKDAANAVPFSMTVKELNLMETDLTGLSLFKANVKRTLAPIGSAFGMPLTLGSTVSRAVEDEEDEE